MSAPLGSPITRVSHETGVIYDSERLLADDDGG